MNNSSFASTEKKVYRFNGFYRWYHFVTGAVFLCVAVLAYAGFDRSAVVLLIFSVPMALLSVFLIARPLTSAVIVDQYSVTYKGVFSENSVQRSSIKAIERVHTGKGTLLVLWDNAEQKDGLSIPVILFAFDDAWDDWLSGYRDLSSDQPLSLFPPEQG